MRGIYSFERFIAFSLGLLLLASRAEAVTPSFQGLGDLPGGGFASRAQGVSADGSVVIGYSYPAQGNEAFRWTQAGGMAGLGFPPNESMYSTAYSVSANGGVVVGAAHPFETSRAFRWTQADGMVELGKLPGTRASWASDVSGDGAVVVGRCYDGYNGYDHAFRWTQAGGMVALGDLPGSLDTSQAHAVSADGVTIVGESYSTNGLEGFRWTQAGGMVGLGDLPGGNYGSVARDVSANGSVIVGMSWSARGCEAFRWTQAGGMVALGDLPGDAFSSGASAVSGDGSIVVGDGMTTAGWQSFIWDASHGMRNLKTVLEEECGLNLTGWRLSETYSISADGAVIVGAGINPSGQTEAWVAVVPEPATLSLLALGGLALIRRRKRDRISP